MRDDLRQARAVSSQDPRIKRCLRNLKRVGWGEAPNGSLGTCMDFTVFCPMYYSVCDCNNSGCSTAAYQRGSQPQTDVPLLAGMMWAKIGPPRGEEGGRNPFSDLSTMTDSVGFDLEQAQDYLCGRVYLYRGFTHLPTARHDVAAEEHAREESKSSTA